MRFESVPDGGARLSHMRRSAEVPGLMSKVWLADRKNNVYGGVYKFENRSAADAYIASELFGNVSSNPAFTEISVKRFGVLAAPTAVTRGA